MLLDLGHTQAAAILSHLHVRLPSDVLPLPPDSAMHVPQPGAITLVEEVVLTLTGIVYTTVGRHFHSKE